MAISYPISLPSKPQPSSISISKKTAMSSSTSPSSFAPQIYIWSGQLWAFEFNWPPCKRAVAEPLVAALSSLNGMEGSVLLGDTANLTPRGIATGTPLVNGASQTGYDLATKGWTASQTGIMLRGDWLQLGTGNTSRLYKVMADANSDGSGNATLTLWPMLRSSPANNAAIVISSPKSKFMLVSGDKWDIDAAKIYGISASFVEDLRP